MWHGRGKSLLDQWQESADKFVSLVPCHMGEADELAVVFGTSRNSVFVLSWTATDIKMTQVMAAVLRPGATYRCDSAENGLWWFWHGVRI